MMDIDLWSDRLSCRYCGVTYGGLTWSHDACDACLRGLEPDRSSWRVWVETPAGTIIGPWRKRDDAEDFARLHGARVYEDA